MIDWILVTDLTLITLNIWLGWDAIKLIQTEEVISVGTDGEYPLILY